MSQNLSLIVKDNSMNNLFPVDEGVSSQNKKDYSPSINQKRREKLILSRNVGNKDQQKHLKVKNDIKINEKQLL
jgi:hypothetical protein